ncbi:MAG: flagellar type III secretion system pore protein FliP, partial [Deltaproteobacteria bacterium]|nr:flagellar type III secretion system pore protein FliP [Deltaproteobacteria bacterium]
MKTFSTRNLICLLVLSVLVIGQTMGGGEAEAQLKLPSIQIGFGDADGPEQISSVLQIMLALTVLTLAPAILVLFTSFTRIIVVFSFLRQAMGTQQMPPNQIMIGLALFLSFFIMSPVLSEINQKALQPYLNEEINQTEALNRAQEPIRKFMLAQTREKDLALFVSMAQKDRPKNISEVSTLMIVPAFALSEIRTAFQ